MKYEFLYAKVGSTFNPQNKIIGARVYYETENIIFTVESESNNGNPHKLKKQDIMLTTSVSFIEYDQDNSYKTYSPPPPPILLSVPYDIFYPFEVNAASKSNLISMSSLIAGLFLVAINALGLGLFRSFD